MEDIPEPLTRLVRLIMKGFYNVEHKIIVDMLIRRRETKEDDLMDVLKFERKHLRSLIQQLKQDRFIGVRLIVETGADGKSTRHNYYSINYRMFVNVVKYKIDHMRRKLETEERDLTSRSSFICESCKKTFTDLEADQIYDPIANRFRCSYCDGSVVEDPNVQPKADSRLVMAKYNQQMEPIYLLLQETENIKWSILEADRNNITNNNNQNDVNNAKADNNSATITPANGSTTEIQVEIKRPNHEDWSSDNRHTIEALLLREEGNGDDPQPSVVGINRIQNGHNGYDSFIDEDDEDDESAPVVLVGSQRVPINRITDEHIKMMSKQQKDDYVRLMQQIYSILYD